MLKSILEFFSLLTPDQRKRFFILQILLIIMTVAEVASIFSITPFMAIVGDPSILQRENFLSMLYLKSNLDEPYEFIFYLGLVVLTILTISALISIFITWRLAMFATKIGVEIGDSLYSHYLNQDWLFHTKENSSNLTKKIGVETTRLTTDFILPLMYVNARLFLTLLIVLMLFLYDPIILIISLIVFSSAYIIIFKLARRRLETNSKDISDMFSERFKLMNEGFGGIKEVLLLDRSDFFKKRFIKAGKKLSNGLGVNRAVALIPRYFMELLGFASMVILVIYLISNSKGNLGLIMPILSIYAIAGVKLLPAFQQIYNGIASAKGNLSAYESIREDLINIKTVTAQKVEANQQVWSKNNEISLKNITFNYPEKKTIALKNISLVIKPNTTVGFVGTSGSGKSTLIDVIIGLIKPQQGEITIDGTPLIRQNLRTWQNKIGIVPQVIFLTEGTISENVAFGIPQDLINHEQVKKVLKLAHLEEWVLELENGIYSKVGERGIQLSGGQRQRIGIARALYYEADVLVFDEATSALDGITEKAIINAIHDLTGKKTVIMIAHKLGILQKCDQIFLMNKGSIVDSGNYQQLLEKNEEFKKM
jgi:ABC-type multidrug transport system fused ATPase/permease subunit